MKRATAVGVFLVLTAAASASARGPGGTAAEQRATQLFELSAEAYRGGRFKEAIDLLKEAYRLAPDAILVYNLARAYEGLGDRPNAVESYTAYLRAAPDARDRASVEQRIAALRAGIEEGERLRREGERLRREREAAELRERQARAQAAQQRQARSPSAAPWIVAGAGGASLAAGAIFGLVARGRNDAAATAPQSEVPKDNSDARSFAILADVALGVGSVLVATGVVWGLLDVRAASRSPRGVALAPWVAPGGGGVWLRVE